MTKHSFFIGLICSFLMASLVQAWSKDPTPFIKLATTFVVIEQPGASAVRKDLVKQLEAADFLEKKLTEPKPDKRMNDLIRVLAESYAQIGARFSFLGEDELACFYYGKALFLEKRNSKRQLDYAIQLTWQGELAQAETLFEAAFKDKTLLPNASFYRKAYAELLLQKKDYERAAVQFNAAIAMSSQPREVNEAMLGLIVARSYAEEKPVFPSKVELKALNLTLWPGPVIAYLSGDLSEKKLMSLLEMSDDEDAQKRLAILLYYVGKLNLLAREDAYAKACFLSVLALKNNQMGEMFLSKQSIRYLDTR